MFIIYRLGALSERGQQLIFLRQYQYREELIAGIEKILTNAKNHNEEFHYQVQYQNGADCSVIMMTGFVSFVRDYFETKKIEQ